MKPQRSLYLEGERPPSWNQLWEQTHWSKRVEIKNLCKAAVLSASPERDLINSKCSVHFTCFIKGRKIDVDNICVKPYIDALIGYWFIDDNLDFINRLSVSIEMVSSSPGMLIEASYREES